MQEQKRITFVRVHRDKILQVRRNSSITYIITIFDHFTKRTGGQ